MSPVSSSRRDFLKYTGFVAASAFAAPAILPGQTADPAGGKLLKVGLVGCGGRGSGAAKQALKADKNTSLVAMADVFEDKLKTSLQNLQKDREVGTQVAVKPERAYVGLDAFKKLIESDVDVVLLASPPGFRPEHLKLAVAAGKHVFCEKPVAVDAPGIRQVLEAADEARKKKLSLVSGFCWRYNLGERAAFTRVNEGAIGPVRTVYSTYNTSGLWMYPRKENWSDLEWQLKNWLYFSWLSGDHLVEQAVHSVDKLAWAFGDQPPLRAIAHGGRQVRTSAAYGHIYDHFEVVYEYPEEARGFLFCRQQDNCANDNSDVIYGTKGTCRILGFRAAPYIRGENEWKYTGQRPDMYQVEHDELFASIRSGKAHNDGAWMANSTMMAIMGRMAAYTGKAIAWEEALNSKENLMPAKLDFSAPLPVAEVAMPGKTPFV